MLNLLATIAAEDVGTIIATLIGAGVVGGGAGMLAKAKPVKVEPQPLVIDKLKNFATKDDLDALEDKLSADIDKLETRVDNISPILGELKGKLDGVDNVTNQILALLLKNND